MIYEDIDVNKRNTFMLFFFFFCLLTFLGWLAGTIYAHPYAGVVLGVLISVCSVFTSYYLSDKLVLAATGAYPAERGMYTELYYAVEGIALAAGLPAPKVYVMDSDEINAFATGRNPGHAIICVTTGAFKKLDKTELEGVVGHEMSHIKNYDILVGSVAAVLAGSVLIMSDLIRRSSLRSRISRTAEQKGILFVILAVMSAIAAPLAALVIQNSISRQREFLADANSVLLTRYPQGLISALTKIKKEIYNTSHYSTAIQHMYIQNPNYMKAESLFSTHPPVEARIERLSKNLYNADEGSTAVKS
jgi:heat shock protein HtpX